MKTYLTKHKPKNWKFDSEVAKNFDLIAEKNIPSYKKVINKSLLIAGRVFKNDLGINIIDVGSAIGYTMDVFYKNGYINVFGVESSQDMIDSSLHKDKIILSEKFPKKKKFYNLVIANWTLHFVKERKKYLKDISDSLSTNGILILTEKMSVSDVVHDLYHDFKRSKGVSDKEIDRKRQAVENILITKSLQWYFKTLKDVGFKELEIVHADWCFVTLLCKK